MRKIYDLGFQISHVICHAKSGVSCHVTFPARIVHEQAGICRSLRLIARMSGVSWRRPGAGFQLPFQIGANGLQSFGRGCFEAKNQRGLRVGGTNESPAIIEADTNSVNRDDFTNHGIWILGVRRIRLFCRLDKPVSYRSRPTGISRRPDTPCEFPG